MKSDVIADWFYVTKDNMDYCTKKMQPREQLNRVYDLQKTVWELQELFGDLNSTAWKHFLTDTFIVQQGVYKWNTRTKSFKKVSDQFSGLSLPWRLNKETAV